jgi:hypothetical protein
MMLLSALLGKWIGVHGDRVDPDRMQRHIALIAGHVLNLVERVEARYHSARVRGGEYVQIYRYRYVCE